MQLDKCDVGAVHGLQRDAALADVQVYILYQVFDGVDDSFEDCAVAEFCLEHVD